MQLAILRRARFGRSSERLDRDIEQLELLIGDMEESDAERQARLDRCHFVFKRQNLVSYISIA
ncbi:MAG: transposase domain-containing protein [Methylocystis sp.]